MNCRIILPAVAGSIFLALGILLPLLFPSLMNMMLDKKLKILPGSEMVEKNFKKVPVPIYFQIYFFNLSNPDEFVYEGEKPMLNQLGPYTYLQVRERLNISWDHELGTVKYNEKKTYFFDKEKSAGSEEDMITLMNPVYLAVTAKGENAGSTMATILGFWGWQFESFTPIMTHSVKELTFSGYYDPVVKALYDLSEKEKYASGLAGFFHDRNGTLDKEREIYSGEAGMQNYQEIYKHHHKTNISYWKTDECNMLNGTYGSQFPRPINISEKLFMFSPDICTSMYVIYEKEVVYGGLQLHRFILPESAMEVSEKTECRFYDDFFRKKSIIDISRCRDGAPVAMSTPHFFQSSEEVINSVDGLSPNKEDHETYMDIDPNTGVIVRAAKRLQVNFAVRRYTKVSPDLENVPELILPVLWVNESVTVPLPRAQALHEKLTKPKIMVTYISLALILLGIVFILTSIVTAFCCRRKKIIEKTKK